MLKHDKVVIPEKFKDHPIFNELLCGVNFGFMARRGYYSREDVKAQPALMKKAGVNWVTLNMNFCQEYFYSTKTFLDFEFSTGELETAQMIKSLHDNGIKVLLKPCLTPLDSAWMGSVNFPDGTQIQGRDTSHYWKEWFDSFIEAEKYFADFAEKTKVDALIIGAEYLGTEGQSDGWRRVIAEIRKLYSGPITYEFTHASRKNYSLDWMEDIDFLSYSYYPPACPQNGDEPDAKSNPSYTVEQMKDFLSSRKSKIDEICQGLFNKPIAFTEYGVRSAHGCIMRPYDYLWETYYDGQEQADYMEASFQTFWEIPQWMGFFWWKWDETQIRPHYYGDPNGDKGFTIQGKPAENVFRRWVGKEK